jgi:hypothetical protein
MTQKPSRSANAKQNNMKSSLSTQYLNQKPQGKNSHKGGALLNGQLSILLEEDSI